MSIIEIHILQNHGAGRLNSDELGETKTINFGGTTRARISSQNIKRAARMYMSEHNLIPKELQAKRTRQLYADLTSAVMTLGAEENTAQRAVTSALGGLKLGPNEEGQSSVLVLLGNNERDALAKTIHANLSSLAAIDVDAQSADETVATKKSRKKKNADSVPEEVTTALTECLVEHANIDLALYGRMMAELPASGRDGSVQVAHAIGIQAMAFDTDYFVAIDNLAKSNQPKAGMLGMRSLDGSTYYKYAAINLSELEQKLGNKETAALAAQAFARAFILSRSSAGQNAAAAQNAPEFVMLVERNGQSISLSNAFLKPASNSGQGLIQNAVDALLELFQSNQKVFALNHQNVAILNPKNCDLGNLAEHKAESLESVLLNIRHSLPSS